VPVRAESVSVPASSSGWGFVIAMYGDDKNTEMMLVVEDIWERMR
jgi:hypothetical protein